MILVSCVSVNNDLAAHKQTKESLIMRELTENEVSDVSGGLIPLVVAIIGIDIALNAAFLGYAAYAANRSPS